MDCPSTILSNGTLVRTHKALDSTRGMMISQRHLDARVADKPGKITGVVPGHGGDVYWVQHEEVIGTVPAAYCFSEFELVVPEWVVPEPVRPTAWEHLTEDAPLGG